MVGTVTIFVSLASIVDGDLIGFNRLSNNIQSFYRFRDGKNLNNNDATYQSIFENPALTKAEKQLLISNILENMTVPHLRQQKHNRRSRVVTCRRLQNCRRLLQNSHMPFPNQKKTKQSGGLLLAGNRLTAYTRRMSRTLQ